MIASPQSARSVAGNSAEPSEWSTVSVVITTYNADEWLEECLESVRTQDYPPEKVEIILVDDGSVDRSLEIAAEFTDRLFHSGRNYCEISRAQGIRHARNDLVLFLDADNSLPSRDFLRRLAMPFQAEPNLVGSYPYKFQHLADDPAANRYCALFGLNDPYQFYLKSREHLMWTEDSWGLPGDCIDKGNYFLVEFGSDEGSLTLGAIGFLIRRSHLTDKFVQVRAPQKRRPKNAAYEGIGLGPEIEVVPAFFHSDACNAIVHSGQGKFAAVKQTVIHHHCANSREFVGKLMRNYRYFVEYRSVRSHVWVLNSPLRLLLATLAMGSIMVPTAHAVRGFLAHRDWAWFLHPVYCLAVVLGYSVLGLREAIRSAVRRFFP